MPSKYPSSAPSLSCTFVVADASASSKKDIQVDVSVRNNKTCIEIEVANRAGPILGDIRGIFFNLGKASSSSSNNPASKIDHTTINITSWKVNDGSAQVGPPSKTKFQCSKSGDFPKIPSNVNMNGKGGVYNCAVEVSCCP
jgi:hypothetical protein